VDLVAQELDAHRMARLGREAIHDAAPNGDLSRLRHLADCAVPGRRENAQQLLAGDEPLRVEGHRGSRQDRGGDRPGQSRCHRGHQDARLSRLEPVERLDPAGSCVRVGLPLGQEGDPASQEKFQVPREGRRHLVGPGEDQERPPGPDVARGQGQRAGRAVEAGEANAPWGLQILTQIRQLEFAPEMLRKHGQKRSRQ
jgi:hypothetical protein